MTKLRFISPADTILNSSAINTQEFAEIPPPVGTRKLHVSLVYDVYYTRVSSMVSYIP